MYFLLKIRQVAVFYLEKENLINNLTKGVCVNEQKISDPFTNEEWMPPITLLFSLRRCFHSGTRSQSACCCYTSSLSPIIFVTSPLRFTISLGVLQGDISILSGLHVLVGTECVGGKTIYFLWWNLELRRLGRPNSVLLFPLLH